VTPGALARVTGMRVGVVGAGGRMGREVCRTVLHRPGLELAAAVDPGHAGFTVAELLGTPSPAAESVMVTEDLSALAPAGVEVVVDFSHLESSRATLAHCASAGIHAVVGTTGFTEADLDDLAEQFVPGSVTGANCIVAANFAIGAVLMMRFAAMAAPWFDSAEIIELHHEAKRDAPSGTSLRTAEGMAAARASAGKDGFLADATSTVVVEGARGGDGPGGIRIHSVRLPGLVAHQEVVFGSTGQGLTIRHDSYDRASFMDGVVLAVESVASRPGLTLGIEPLLGI
jgi:4-hydroxy-tetrahydrodipicolinate reductase